MGHAVWSPHQGVGYRNMAGCRMYRKEPRKPETESRLADKKSGIDKLGLRLSTRVKDERGRN